MPDKRRSQEEFIRLAKQEHGDKYKYHKVVYKGSKVKVSILCPQHGEFLQVPAQHLRGNGCPVCGREVPRQHPWKRTTASFIHAARKVHGNTFVYDNVKYVNSKTKVVIACRSHGKFRQTPSDHLSGKGCRKCADELLSVFQRKSREDFLQEARQVHGKRYNYSKVRYRSSREKVEIVCREHGSFWQNASNHLRGKGCPKCAIIDNHNHTRKSQDQLIAEFVEVHGDRYDYSRVEYKNIRQKVAIICPKHGQFQQEPVHHKNGHGCPACGINAISSQKEFISRCIDAHGTAYDLSQAVYKHWTEKIVVICSKHGPWKIRPSNFLVGRGCPRCKSSRGEREVARILDELGIGYKEQWTEHDCIINSRPARFDFYLPEYEMIIEYDGPQHFKPVQIHGVTDAEKAHEVTRRSDRKKNAWARKNNYEMLRVRFDEDVREAITSWWEALCWRKQCGC